MTWKILGSTVVFRHPRLVLLEDDVELPNGQRTTYLKKAPDRGGVTAIAENSDGQILVQTEYSHPPQKVLYQFPGGSIEAEESPEEATIRELIEESNLTAHQITPIGKYLTDNRRSPSYTYVFHLREISPVQGISDPEEFIQSFWFSKDDLRAMIRSGDIENCHLLAAWQLYEASDIYS